MVASTLIIVGSFNLQSSKIFQLQIDVAVLIFDIHAPLSKHQPSVWGFYQYLRTVHASWCCNCTQGQVLA
jgi:hypothetical protein